MDNEELFSYELRNLPRNNELIPTLAKSKKYVTEIVDIIQHIETNHDLYCTDASQWTGLKEKSIHLVVTSPPYWTLKRYEDAEGQLGHIGDYEKFLAELDKVWTQCFNALVSGGRLICVVGDVCLSRKKNNGEHTVIPLHASIQEHCRRIGFSNVAPIIWHKISNATYEVAGNSRFLGKPYEPNGVIKNDIEFILMLRKPGGYRKPTFENRILSVISDENHKKWFQQIWTGLGGASTKNHPAPYPLELAERLVRMFSFVGDTVYDPFMGTGTTNLAASRWGRNSIGVELIPEYFKISCNRMLENKKNLHRENIINIHG